jgi:PAS domain S-box-containing protein
MNSSLPPSEIAFSRTDFDRLFPFHLLIDQDLRVMGAGRSLLRVCPDITLGKVLYAGFALISPTLEMSFEALAAAEDQALCWQHERSGLRFRGGSMLLKTPFSLAFLWTPWLEDNFELDQYGLRPEDFPCHDPTIVLLQAKAAAVQDERDLSDKVSAERSELMLENHELSRQFGLLWDELVMLKQEEADVYKLSLIASKAESPIVITDVEGRVEWVNSGFTQITGYSQDDMVGKKPGAVLQGPDTDPQSVEYIRRQFAKGESFGIELINYRKSGEAYWVQIEAQPMLDEDNQIVSWMAIERDITEQKTVELTLMQAKKAAEAASRAKSEFLANMSHEIRTPMHGIRGMLELLRRSPLSPEQQEFAGTAARSVETLLSIINDILDFSKIEAGKLQLETIDFDARELVEQICALLATPAHDKGLELSCFVQPGLPSKVQGDPVRLRQIMTNLIGNAIKFTDRGEVSVQVLCDAQSDGQASLRFKVKDTGIGIRPEDLARLFNPFEQVDGATTRQFGGTGLGLAISKTLVNKMGGEVHVESEPGKGSTFWFAIDFTRQPVSETPAVGHLANRRILVAGGNETHRMLVGHLLSEWGADARLVSYAPEAFAMLREAQQIGSPFELVILDVQAPNREWLLLDRAMASEPSLKDLPRVLLSASGSASELECSMGSRIQTVAKPIRQERLLEAIAASLHLKTLSAKPMETQIKRDDTAQFPNCQLLLVEDNPINQAVALKMLKRHKLNITLAENGRVALGKLEQGRYDLVLMDCHMPEMNGYDVTRALRRLEAEGNLSHTPVVALTANASQESREKCLESGMDDFLAKPFLMEELSEMLERWLSEMEAGRTAGASDTAPPAAPIWDQAAALQRLHGDAELLSEMGILFVSEAPKQVEQLLAWNGQDPAASIAETAHFLKGMSLHFCAPEVTRLAEGLERKARAEDISLGEPMLRELVEAVNRLMAALQQDLAATDGGQPA